MAPRLEQSSSGAPRDRLGDSQARSAEERLQNPAKQDTRPIPNEEPTALGQAAAPNGAINIESDDAATAVCATAPSDSPLAQLKTAKAPPEATIISKRVRRFLGASSPFEELVRDGLEAGQQSETIVRAMLQKLSELCEAPEPRRYGIPSLSLNEMIRSLEHAPLELRLDYLRHFLWLAVERPRSTFALNLIPRMMYFFLPKGPSRRKEVAETAEVIRDFTSLLKDSARRSQGLRVLNMLFRSSQSFSQLHYLINQVGKQAILSLKNKQLNEYVAMAVIGSKIRELELPHGVNIRAPAPIVRRRLHELDQFIDTLEVLTQEDPRFSESAFAQHLLLIAKKNRSCLREGIKQSRAQPNTKMRRDLVNRLVGMLRIEQRTFILLERGDDKNDRWWSVSDLEDLERGLREVPEGKLILTPKLRRIQRFNMIDGGNTLGERDWQGPLGFAEGSINHADTSREYNRISSLRIILGHELGHAIHYGSRYERERRKTDSREYIDSCDPIYEFGEFMKIANWRVIPRSQYRLTASRTSVFLRNHGMRVPLGQPLRVEDSEEEITLVYDDHAKALLSYDSHAQFPHDEGSRQGPYEYWANGFASYIFTPKLLIDQAPLVFAYFEHHFHKYHKRQPIQRHLSRRLETDKKPTLPKDIVPCQKSSAESD